MRLNLRNTGLNVSSAESDAMFDSWDENKCGLLQLAELRVSLAKCSAEAHAFNNKPDPAQEQIRKLQKRALLADEAAEATAQADALERELAEYLEELKSRADIRLGALLQKRLIKPGEVVVHWAKSKGEHAGELSKVQFRRAVMKLFAGRAGTGSKGEAPGAPDDTDQADEDRAQQQPQQAGGAATAAASKEEVDAIFDEVRRALSSLPRATRHSPHCRSSHFRLP